MGSCCIAQGTVSGLLGQNMMENEKKKKECVYGWLGHFAVQQKLRNTVNQHYLKKNFFNGPKHSAKVPVKSLSTRSLNVPYGGNTCQLHFMQT